MCLIYFFVVREISVQLRSLELWKRLFVKIQLIEVSYHGCEQILIVIVLLYKNIPILIRI